MIAAGNGNGAGFKGVSIVDSHTAGEPTRVVVSGGPDLGEGTCAERLERFRDQYDHFRSAVVNEPRGSDVLVGALVRPPLDPACAAGVIFFNNVGYLGMCGHGTIGLVVTLGYLDRIQPGKILLETPVGVVEATWHGGHDVSVVNVPSYRKQSELKVDVPGFGTIKGDLAWGGNWFFLVKDHGEELALGAVDRLTDVAWRIRQALNAQGYPEVDHIELFGPPTNGGNARNFVLCPGKAYDRSPCGTGTSAKLACLAASGELAEGEEWIQESILGTTFRGSYRWIDQEKGIISPTIQGSAFVNAVSDLIFDPEDPFQSGIR
jgi:4-hydroxyproline epimerase